MTTEPSDALRYDLAGLRPAPAVNSATLAPFVELYADLVDRDPLDPKEPVPAVAVGHLPIADARAVALGILKAASEAESDAHTFAAVAELADPRLAGLIVLEVRARRNAVPDHPPTAAAD